MRHLIESALVHKRSPHQVLLVAAETASNGSVRFDVDLSPGHPCVRMVPSQSTLLGVELMRQCAIAFAHLGPGVPPGWAFLMNELTFSWQGESVPETPGQFTGHATVRLRAMKRRRDQPSDLQVDVDYLVDGVVLGRGCGDMTVLPPRTYQALRRNAPPIAEEKTGPLGTVLINVRQDLGTLDALLTWNRQDRFVFDHPSDHLSGMLLASAVLQAHLQLTGAQALDISLQCENFAEYDAPVQVSTALTGPGQSLTTITQSGRNIARGRCDGPRPAKTTKPETAQFHRHLTPAP